MTLETALAQKGIVNPQETINAANAAGLPLAYACAMLMLETAGGHNEFGHDPGNAVQGGDVTEARYRELRASVSAGHPSQGVGPTQLTSVFLLDAADKIGGAWKVQPNMTVGFRYLSALQKEHGSAQLGFQHFNGSGPAAVSYGERAMSQAAMFQSVINANTPPPDPNHYTWFDGTVRDLGHGHRGDERALVKEYDQKRVHPHLPGRKARLATLRTDMAYLAGRLSGFLDNKDPDNVKYHRKFRHDGLLARSKGERVVH